MHIRICECTFKILFLNVHLKYLNVSPEIFRERKVEETLRKCKNLGSIGSRGGGEGCLEPSGLNMFSVQKQLNEQKFI